MLASASFDTNSFSVDSFAFDGVAPPVIVTPPWSGGGSVGSGRVWPTHHSFIPRDRLEKVRRKAKRKKRIKKKIYRFPAEQVTAIPLAPPPVLARELMPSPLNIQNSDDMRFLHLSISLALEEEDIEILLLAGV